MIDLAHFTIRGTDLIKELWDLSDLSDWEGLGIDGDPGEWEVRGVYRGDPDETDNVRITISRSRYRTGQVEVE